MLRSLFDALYQQNVMLEGTILKVSMVVPGKDCEEQASVEEVAESTLMCLKSTVPAILPGIVFLSGGQSDEDATAHLDAMNRMGPNPWPLSFSYGRAMQCGAEVVVQEPAPTCRSAKDGACPRPRQRPGGAGAMERLRCRRGSARSIAADNKRAPRGALFGIFATVYPEYAAGTVRWRPGS